MTELTQPNRDFAYDDGFVAMGELLWGDGFLSGGADSLARMFHGIETDGRRVLDIGAGLGGLDIFLVRDQGARSVIGLEVSADLVARATARANAAGLSEKISYQCVMPGPFPLADCSADIAFTKGVLVHIESEAAFFDDVYRVLCPGGVYVSQDWTVGEVMADRAPLDRLRDLFGASLALESLATRQRALAAAGFIDISTELHEDEALVVEREYARMVGALKPALVDLLGVTRYHRECALWRATAAALRDGALVVPTVRAHKPA